MTRVVFVNPETAQVMLQVDTVEAIPMVGDIVIPPSGQIHQIVQRAFIIEEDVIPGPQLVDFSKGKALSITIQCAVMPMQVTEPTEGVRS